MKSVSKETPEKIDRLFRGGSFWSRVLASSEEQVELLHEIGFSGEAGAIPEIACLLVDASGPVFRAAGEAAAEKGSAAMAAMRTCSAAARACSTARASAAVMAGALLATAPVTGLIRSKFMA